MASNLKCSRNNYEKEIDAYHTAIILQEAESGRIRDTEDARGEKRRDGGPRESVCFCVSL